MKELGKWQFISFVSRGMAMLLGLIQSFVIVRILTLSEWGLVQLAASIGGALGIYQHLGLASASTREISASKNNKEVFKIFLTSVLIRYFITIPIAFGLFFFADHIALSIYKNVALAVPVKIYAVTLLFQGFQSILNSVISGTKHFKNLFVYQVAIAFVSVLLYIPFVMHYRVNGYFYAFMIFNLISSISLAFIAFAPLKGFFSLPTYKELSQTFKELFSISMAIYLVKILYTNWEKLGGNVLGLFNSTETVAIFAFALLYAKKLMSISDAVTDVNLPVLSEKYADNLNEFKKLFSKNFDKIFFFIVFSAFVATYWAPQIINLLVGSNKYDQSLPLIIPVILAFIIYSLINIIKSSVLIPAKMVFEMVLAFVALITFTVVFFFTASKYINLLDAMSWGMAVGASIALFYIVVSVKKKLSYAFFNHDHVLITLQALVIAWSGLNCTVLMKTLLFLPYLLLLLWGCHVAKIFTKDELFEAKARVVTLLVPSKTYGKTKKRS